MKWFKHYSNVRHSESLSSFKRKTGFEGMGRYWELLAFLCERFDGEDHTFRLPRETLRELLSIRSWTKLRLFADHLATIRGLTVTYSENVYEIKALILLELMGKDFKCDRSKREKTDVKNKNKNKNNTINRSSTDDRVKLKTFYLSKIKKPLGHRSKPRGICKKLE